MLEFQNLPRIEIHNDETTERGLSKGVDVVDYSRNAEIGGAETIEAEAPCIPPDMTSSLQKPESFGMAPSPILDSDKEPDDWLADQSRYRDRDTSRETVIQEAHVHNVTMHENLSLLFLPDR